MNLKNSASQPDPHVSFLDVIFCLCVFLCVLLSISMSLKNHQENFSNSIEAEEIIEVEEAESGRDSQTARFRGRGGQPKLFVVVDYLESGLVFQIAGHSFNWFDFRRIVCNLDRKESGENPALLFSFRFEERYLNASFSNIQKELGGVVTVLEIESEKRRDRFHYIFNLYKLANGFLEDHYREFKKKNTTEHLGNWDMERIENKRITVYEERRFLGNPYLWFTVDHENKKVLIGPLNDPLSLDPEVFVDVVSSVKGGDGFYIEYRDPKTLRYNPKEEIPEWVMKEVIDPLGFSMMASGS
jgi:hypothetical protein